MVNVALLVRLQAKPGKEEEVEKLLQDGLSVVEGEPGTVAWFAVKFGPSTFGIFDVFSDDDARQAHLSRGVGTALMQKADELLSELPDREGRRPGPQAPGVGGRCQRCRTRNTAA